MNDSPKIYHGINKIYLWGYIDPKNSSSVNKENATV